MEKIIVCEVEELKIDLKKVVEIDDQKILLVYHQDVFYAVDNVCPHAKGHVSEGRVEDGTITCLNHGACFDLKTGKVRLDKLDEDLAEMFEDEDDLPFGPLPTFPVGIEDGKVVISI